MMNRILVPALLASTLLAAGVQAQTGHGHGGAAMSPASGSHLVVGVVRSVDMKNRMVSVAHQNIPSMGMPAMTMGFRLSDGIAPTAVKTGDTVAFVLSAGAQDALTITSLQQVSTAAAGDKATAPRSMGDMHSQSGMAMMEECGEMMKKHKQ